MRDLFDLHAALNGADRKKGAVRPVEQERKVVLGLDVGRLSDQDAVDRVALDVHAEDLAGLLLRVIWTVGQLHAAGLAAPAGLYLRLHDHLADALSRVCGRDLPGFLGGVGDLVLRNRDAVLGEQLLSLKLKQVHWGSVSLGLS